MVDTFSYDAERNEFIAERKHPNGKVHKLTTIWNPETTPEIGYDDLVASNIKALDNLDSDAGVHRLAKKASIMGWNFYYGKVTGANYDEGSIAFGKLKFIWPLGSFFKGKIESSSGQRFIFGAGGAKSARYISVSKTK